MINYGITGLIHIFSISICLNPLLDLDTNKLGLKLDKYF